MRRTICVVLLSFSALLMQAQDEALMRAARYLSGAGVDEEVPEEWVSALEALWGRSVRINSARVRSYDLLSDYQEASLADYRARNGDILSWEELALVDGFSREAVEALRPFLSLASDRNPGASDDTVRIRASVLLRATLNAVGAKGKAGGNHWRAGAAWRGKDGTFFGEWQKGASRCLIGDYNLRFGQGLSLWSGFSMSSLSTPDAFIRRSPGVSPVWSYTSASVHRGMAYEYSARHFRGLMFADLNRNLGLHADWLGRRAQLGLTLAHEGAFNLSLDGRMTLGRSLLAGELACKNGSLAALAALQANVGEHSRLAFQARVIPRRFSGKKNGEYTLAAGYALRPTSAHEGSLTCEASLLPQPGVDSRRLQVRVYTQWHSQLSTRWTLSLRLTERYRNYEASRTDFRADLLFGAAPWQACFRQEVVYCEKPGFLTYLEGGYKRGDWTGYLRLTGFFIDDWDARIYCYERDAPGTFSVPAYYGRGLAAALVGNWKHRFKWFTIKAYIRGSYMIRNEREPTPALNFQLQMEY